MSLTSRLEHKAYWALKHANLDLKTAGDPRKRKLQLMNLRARDKHTRILIYKEKTRSYSFQEKDRIFNVVIKSSHQFQIKEFSGKSLSPQFQLPPSQALLWRGYTTIGYPGPPDFP
ncbi:hypothetical protein Tco_0718842 [Tanacetum coccineum]